MVTTSDPWASWLIPRHHVDDVSLLPTRDRVLDNAGVSAGETVLDLGCGDGLIAFGALERMGTEGRVIFCDASQELLDVCRARATQIGALDVCSFVRASAVDLSPIPDASVDVLTTRAVLLYVENKQRAFNEIYRVLKPGGRLSSNERINSFGYPEASDRFWGYDVSPVRDIADKLKAYYDRVQPPDTNPMLTFDERDLVVLAKRAGFEEIHLDLRVDIAPIPPGDWDSLVSAPQPPPFPLTTLEGAMREALESDERLEFQAHLRSAVEAGNGTTYKAVAWLWATKS